MDDIEKRNFDEVRAFALAAADSAMDVPISAIQEALDHADQKLGQRLLLPPDQRPDDTDGLAQDVRRIRALQRYRLTLDGITA